MLAGITLTLSLPLTTENKANSVNIPTEIPIVQYVSAEETSTDLKAIASSLGADTDYLNIVNYRHSEEFPVQNDSYLNFVNNCTNFEARRSDILFSESVAAGSCLGISILEILSHNGIITPSDIKEGAEFLNEIEYGAESDKYITAYQALQSHFEFDFYERYLFSNFTTAQQTDRLIEIAEKNMAENRYFLICFNTSSMRHAIVGMGITDGKWTYNGNEYDKCILTLDSNVQDSKGNAKPFSKSTCIYINSETKQFYIPAYESGLESKMLIASIDDDTLLNYKGMIAPSDIISTDLSDMNILKLMTDHCEYTVKITDSDGTVHDLESPINKFGRIYFTDNFVKGHDFHFESSIYNSSAKIVLTNQRYYSGLSAYYADVIYDITDDIFTVKSKDGERLRYSLSLFMNEGYYQCIPHFYWWFYGFTTTEIQFEQKENGFLISSDSLIETQISTKDVAYDENGLRTSTSENITEFNITAANEVMISFNDEDEVQLLIDIDKDGIFDTEIEKGDVNSDGIIDSVDASYVLSAYAKASIGERHFLNKEIADFDSDGVIDANDASAILSYYAKQMTDQNY